VRARSTMGGGKGRSSDPLLRSPCAGSASGRAFEVPGGSSFGRGPTIPRPFKLFHRRGQGGGRGAGREDGRDARQHQQADAEGAASSSVPGAAAPPPQRARQQQSVPSSPCPCISQGRRRGTRRGPSAAQRAPLAAAETVSPPSSRLPPARRRALVAELLDGEDRRAWGAGAALREA